MVNNVVIRALTSDDWQDWKQIRLEAIKLYPESFSASYEDESLYTEDMLRQRLTSNIIFGTFDQHKIIGIAGFYIQPAKKAQHRGNLFSMYLKSDYRGQGLADRLVEAVIDHAKTKVIQLHCSVVTSNTAAIKLYQKCGFKIYGTEPRSLKVGDTYHDEHFMILSFDGLSI